MKTNFPLRFLALGVVVIWLLAFVVISNTFADWPTRGQFGDLFGSVNALFSGLAFAAIYRTLRVQQNQLELQRTELRLQREELKLQREEMMASRGELAKQVRVQRAQFEASVAQILVASTQARIDAIKMESEQTQPHNRAPYVQQLYSQADVLKELSKRVEERAESAA